MKVAVEARDLRVVFGAALLLEGLVCALVFALLHLGPLGALPLAGLVATGCFLTVAAEPTGLRVALAVLLGAAVAALWLSLS